MIVKACSMSSDRTLARCEYMYHYKYDERLKKRVVSKGLYMGDWMHQLLEAHYLKRSWQKQFEQLKRKSWDKLFDEEREMYEENGFTPALAYDLMEHYTDHWRDDEKHWEILEVEEFHKLPTPYGFPVVFKVDLLIKRKGRIGLIESKNQKVIPDANERMLSPQAHAYCRLLKTRGIKVDFILWNYIRTTPVPQPQIKKNGELSERKINTDQRMYQRALTAAGIKPKNASEAAAMSKKINSLPPTLALERVTNVPNLAIGELFIKTWIKRHRRALTIDEPMRTFVRSCAWDCDYYKLCQADMRNKTDRKAIIKRDFLPVENLK